MKLVLLVWGGVENRESWCCCMGGGKIAKLGVAVWGGVDSEAGVCCMVGGYDSEAGVAVVGG